MDPKHMLNTNVIPDDVECQQIRDFVDPRKKAAQLAEQIVRMQKVLDDLARKCDDLTKFIDAHLALVSPARRLPDDVVREIFMASLPKNRNCAISAKDSPLLLCTICQSWRNLALSTPRMWASIHIVAPLNDKIERMINTVHAWLSRSGALPLSISLTVSRSSTWPPPDASSLLAALIRYFSLRWKRIRFILPPDQFEPLSSLSPEDVPVLEKAIVASFDGQHAAHTAMSPRLAFLQTTSLSSASLNATFISPQTPIRLEFLRHLSFEAVGVPQTHAMPQFTLEILRRCVLLETCTIFIYGDLDVPSALPCRMEHLRNLCVRSIRYGGSLFFEALVLPNLRRLEYTGSRELDFLPLLTSAQSVECLVLNSGAETTALLAVLRLTPMLEELDLSGDPTAPSADPEITYSVPDGQFIPLLTPYAESEFTVVCPRLRRITLMRFSTLSDVALLEFILARKDLARIDVLFSRKMQVDIAPSVQHLLAAGLSLSVEYQPPPPINPYSPSEAIEENYDRRSMH
ncbi:hypothetical protein C8J57DRAFT_1237322 [Mycena rebaudengoi]|nr:hypothetical protein C8J57DRAFT_1237322 [Mycena rebaudengoi]